MIAFIKIINKSICLLHLCGCNYVHSATGMAIPNKVRSIKIIPVLLLLFLSFAEAPARDYYITGKVTDANGAIVPNAKDFNCGRDKEYAAKSGSDGTYSLRISNIYDNISGVIEAGVPYPNPFTYSVNIPFIINSSGSIRFSIYSFSGQKIMEAFFDSISAGSYHIVWDGCNQNGVPQPNGLYFYAINFKGKTQSGKLIKASGFSSYSAGTAIEPDMMPPVILPPPASSGSRLSHLLPAIIIIL